MSQKMTIKTRTKKNGKAKGMAVRKPAKRK